MTFFLTTGESFVDWSVQKVLIHFEKLHFVFDQCQEVYRIEFFKPMVASGWRLEQP